MMYESQAIVKQKVTPEQLREEILAMLKVCFEGTVEKREEMIFLTLPGGESFCLSVGEA